ncbi:MAG: peroxidase-related enzyme [Bacteroidota bacterium]
MRLSVIESSLKFHQRIIVFFIKRKFGVFPGPIAVMTYRKRWFGAHYAKWLNETMHKSEHWTRVEMELMATYVSRANACSYCHSIHERIANVGAGADLVEQVMNNLEAAPISAQLKALLPFLEKITKHPDAVSKEDFATMLNEGLSHDAIEEALHIMASFNIINRLMDAFGYEPISERGNPAAFIWKQGYGITSLPG